MNRSKLIAVLLLIFMLSSCSSTLAIPNNQPEPKGMLTQTSPMPTLTPTSSLEGTTDLDFPKNSINLTSTAFDIAAEDGFLIFGKVYTDPYYIYDMKNKKITETIDFYSVSPNKKFMLTGACPTKKCNYILRTVDKIIKTNIPTEDDWASARWLDNKRVVFLHRLERNEAVQPQDVVIYNLFTDEKSSIRLNLPNPYMMDKSGGPTNLIQASLDPSLKRVIFKNQNDSLVLWNLDTQTEMVSLPFADAVSQFGSNGWSSDGKKFITTSPNEFRVNSDGEHIGGANELFMFDVDGNLTQLTHYNQEFQFVNIENAVWSPDNRHIALWLRTSDDDNAKNLRWWLAIFDTSTLQTKIYRLASLSASHLVWSPDGKKIIASTKFPTDDDSNLILIDIAHETKLIIPDTQGMWAEDWMTP